MVWSPAVAFRTSLRGLWRGHGPGLARINKAITSSDKMAIFAFQYAIFPMSYTVSHLSWCAKEIYQGKIFNHVLEKLQAMEDGKRFSLVYLEKGAPIQDSERFRRRLSSYCEAHFSLIKSTIISNIELETGVHVPIRPVIGKSLSQFFLTADIRDILDSITIIYSIFDDAHDRRRSEWHLFISRVFKEENIGFRLDSKCGVHYYIDEEFERNKFSTLRMMHKVCYSATKSAFEDSYRHFDGNPIDTKAAVRSIFESIEILVKQIVQTRNLNKYIVENDLKNKFMPIYNGDETAKAVVSKMFDSFALWVDGIHLYRHGQDDDQPVRPPIDLAVYILSSGSSFLRWLIELNEKLIALEQ